MRSLAAHPVRPDRGRSFLGLRRHTWTGCFGESGTLALISPPHARITDAAISGQGQGTRAGHHRTLSRECEIMTDREPRDAFPTSDLEIGAALRRLRGRVSIRTLEKESKISKSALQRYESGRTPIPLAYAKVIDDAYKGEGWIEAAISVVGRPRWKPWEKDNPQGTFFHRWPAQHQGLVWVIIQPAATRVDQHHAIRLRWGPWCCDLTIELPREGVALITGKDLDDVAVTINLDIAPSAYALFGIGAEVGSVSIIDIRQKWQRAQ